MPLVGMDVDAVSQVTVQLRSQASSLEASARALDQLVSTADAHWRGPDVEQFCGRWRDYKRTALQAATGLRELADTAQRNVDAQRETSDRLDAAGGPGGSGASGGTNAGGSGPDSGKVREQHDKDAGPLTPLDTVPPMDDAALASGNLRQGAIGDCSLLSSLGVLADADPEFVRQHMVRNEDGSYTVTLYDRNAMGWLPWVDDFDKTEVTIPARFFENGVKGPDGNPSWASVFEAAVAEHRGGSANDIWSQNAGTTLEWLTGRPADRVDDPSLASIKQGLADGRIYVAGSNDDEGPIDNSPNAVGDHAYMVTGVEEVDGQARIVLRNPWGTEPDLHLTEQEFHDNFGEVDSVAGK